MVNFGSSFAIGIGNFAVVLFGGVFIGVVFGLLAAFIVMFTRNVPTLAPAVSVCGCHHCLHGNHPGL